MKTTTLIAALMLVAGSAFAGNTGGTNPEKEEDAYVSFVAWKEGVHRLFYTNTVSSKVIVRITDKQGRVIVDRMVQNKDGFTIPFNFKKRMQGEYTIVVKDGNKEFSESFRVARAVQ